MLNPKQFGQISFNDISPEFDDQEAMGNEDALIHEADQISEMPFDSYYMIHQSLRDAGATRNDLQAMKAKGMEFSEDGPGTKLTDPTGFYSYADRSSDYPRMAQNALRHVR